MPPQCLKGPELLVEVVELALARLGDCLARLSYLRLDIDALEELSDPGAAARAALFGDDLALGVDALDARDDVSELALRQPCQSLDGVFEHWVRDLFCEFVVGPLRALVAHASGELPGHQPLRMLEEVLGSVELGLGDLPCGLGPDLFVQHGS